MADGPRAEVLALLHAARVEPEDDTPRLILADWLEERDDPRGTFVRLQCRLAHLSLADPERPALQAQAEELRQLHEAEWLGDLLDQGERAYERGLLRLTMSKFRFASSPIQWLAGGEVWAWVEALRLQGGLSGRLARFLDSPLIDTLAVLDLSGNGLGPSQARQLTQIPRLAALSELNLNENGLGALGAQWLAGCTGLSGLTTLGLSGNGIEDVGLASLLDSPHLNRLRKIDLEGCLLGADGMARLSASAWLPRLRHLNLRYNDLRPQGVAALAAVRESALEHLDLFGTRCEDEGVAALAGSPLARRLRWLDLSRNRLTTRGLEALAASPHLAHLEDLRLFGNQMVDVGLGVLLAMPHLGRLRRLDLGHNLLTAEGMAALADAAGRLNLDALDLGYNPLGDEGLEVLLRSGVLAGVQELGLNACSLTALGTTRLAEAELPKLRLLDLRNNGKPRGPQAQALRERLGDGLHL